MKLSLHCNQCKKTFANASDWARHLIKFRHQKVSVRNLALHWGLSPQPRDDKHTKEKILVVRASVAFCTNSQKLGHAMALDFLGYLNKQWSKDVLVNLVWAPASPKMAFFLWPSKNTVDKIVSAGAGLKWGNYKIHLRRATDFTEYQWNGMMEAFLYCLVSPKHILKLT